MWKASICYFSLRTISLDNRFLSKKKRLNSKMAQKKPKKKKKNKKKTIIKRNGRTVDIWVGHVVRVQTAGSACMHPIMQAEVKRVLQHCYHLGTEGVQTAGGAFLTVLVCFYSFVLHACLHLYFPPNFAPCFKLLRVAWKNKIIN